MQARFESNEFAKIKDLLTIYDWGQKTLITKLDIIQEDLRKFQNNTAIDYVRSRIKTPESIAQKLHKMGHEITAENANKYLQDIAGIRIITPFARDIYFLTELIRKIPDIHIIKEKDYISSPKPSGYRSYHIIVNVPVFYSGGAHDVVVEIQIRTEAMNFWATLEHKVRYKFQDYIPQHLNDELIVIANQIAYLDDRMYRIHDIVTLINPKDEKY